MKRLYLIRHAKTSWEHPELPDFERPLNERGEQDARDMARFLKKKKVMPDAIISSPAKRAITTAEIMAKELKFPKDKIITEPQIYDTGVEELIEIIKDFDDKINEVLFFGHNPSLNWLANFLCNDHLINIPTCGIYCVNSSAKHWKKFTDADNAMAFFEYPKHHDTGN